MAFDALVEACLDLSEEIDSYGSEDVQAAYRTLLNALGRQIAQRLREAGEMP